MRRLVLWSRAHAWVADLPLYAVFAVLAPAPSSLVPYPVLLVPYLFLLPLPFRRKHPKSAAVLVLCGVAAGYLTEVWAHDRGRGELAAAIALCTVVRLGHRRFAALTACGIFALETFWTLRWGVGLLGYTAFLTSVPVQVAAWTLGEYGRAKETLAGEQERGAALAESERDALARAAAAEERTRIARELHDVLAHSVSVIVVNAEGAKLMRHHDPGTVGRTLDTISRTGRDALGELRRLLEVLHASEPARRPQPTVAELEGLVTKVNAGGRAVALEVEGDPGALPESAGVQAYRIVQEGLTNLLRHAPSDATGRVVVRCSPGLVLIEVTNSGGSAPPAPRLPSGGRGLAGMRQRVELFHGALDAGPTADGGYRVRASLVLDRAAA
ncbi:sensor histidine kinase [Amycolatopsis sp. CA-230715]|uniref:sensor histidine kinase n=1 Tax=Amycolatopsis sp. CA-230715 TaxID=2745196 RepID=UPI001C03041A|nr:histidine kinase [Amycolatopsis sp. CA-230715]QWF77707.1 hypothetical protein HUW46_01099 [Amycolatopsis sp. CA-230715]